MTVKRRPTVMMLPLRQAVYDITAQTGQIVVRLENKVVQLTHAQLKCRVVFEVENNRVVAVLSGELTSSDLAEPCSLPGYKCQLSMTPVMPVNNIVGKAIEEAEKALSTWLGFDKGSAHCVLVQSWSALV